ncbi:MAG TPA: hypothetical protein VN758_00940 [Solirubrobacterales bacterium]|nr:hypothetical protein [Solirubrobacterales bacterium]
MSDKQAGHAPALFDNAAFAEDLNRTSDTGRDVALAARREYEQEGAPLADLLACDEEGPEGTALVHCMKVYLPPPDGSNGKFGMVFRIELRGGKAVLVFAAFGVRHQPRDSHAPTVYEIAHQRLCS